jgi:hypothetical protein
MILYVATKYLFNLILASQLLPEENCIFRRHNTDLVQTSSSPSRRLHHCDASVTTTGAVK